MKKIIVTLLVIALAVGIVACTVQQSNRTTESFNRYCEEQDAKDWTEEIHSAERTATATITTMDAKTGDVTLTDTTGNVWELIEMDTTQYTTGQKVTITFNTCGTDNITDDVIVSLA